MNLSRRVFTSTLLLMAGGLLTLTSCDQNKIDPDQPSKTGPGSGSGLDGYLTGVVTDPQGKPLPKANVYVGHTVFVTDGPEVKTAADGSYKIQMVNLAGEWVASGYILKQYNDRVYKIKLDPENDEPFTSDEKPVRNFQWKLTGHIPDPSLDLYYGGSMELSRDLNADGLYDKENIEFTLTPVGSLIDGSTGKTLKLQIKKKSDSSIKDIPMGRYKVSAIYKPTGEQLLVRNAWEYSDELVYDTSVTMDFFGTDASYRANSMGIGYINRR